MLFSRKLDHLIMRHFNYPTDRFMVRAQTKKSLPEKTVQLEKSSFYSLGYCTQLVDDPATGKVEFKRIPEEINWVNKISHENVMYKNMVVIMEAASEYICNTGCGGRGGCSICQKGLKLDEIC